MAGHLIRITALFLFSFVGVAQQTADDIRRVFLDASSDRVLVVSHRATHHRYPENSLKAIEDAIGLGVDIVEIDVKVSKDGIPFLMHDRTMNRTTTGKGDPEEYTWEELQQFYIVDKGRQTNLKIPTLEDALNIADGKIMVDLDMKTDRIEAVAAVVKKTETSDYVMFFDSDFEVLLRLKAISSEFMIMPRTYAVSEIDSAVALFDPPAVHIDFSFYTKESVAMIRSSHARAWINALGDCDDDIRAGKTKRTLKKLLQNGASIIQTDEPVLLLEFLREHGYRPEYLRAKK
jgi:glycerophosphoryl diester phosphodiesterase